MYMYYRPCNISREHALFAILCCVGISELHHRCKVDFTIYDYTQNRIANSALYLYYRAYSTCNGVGVVHALMSLYLKTDHDPNSSSRATRRSSVAASVVWEALKRKKAQRGSPKAKCDFLWESCTIDSN